MLHLLYITNDLSYHWFVLSLIHLPTDAPYHCYISPLIHLLYLTTDSSHHYFVSLILPLIHITTDSPYHWFILPLLHLTPDSSYHWSILSLLNLLHLTTDSTHHWFVLPLIYLLHLTNASPGHDVAPTLNQRQRRWFKVWSTTLFCPALLWGMLIISPCVDTVECEFAVATQAGTSRHYRIQSGNLSTTPSPPLSHNASWPWTQLLHAFLNFGFEADFIWFCPIRWPLPVYLNRMLVQWIRVRLRWQGLTIALNSHRKYM